MPLQQIIPTWLALNGCNDTSASGISSLRTGEPVNAGGLALGDHFDLTEQEANSLSDLNTGLLHSGRYRRIQVHEGATAVNVRPGMLGGRVTSLIPELNILTTLDQSYVGTRRVVVFLNTIDPGNYGFVQELGITMVMCGSILAPAIVGQQAFASNAWDGTADTTSGTSTIGTLGYWLDVPQSNTLTRIVLYRPVFQG